MALKINTRPKDDMSDDEDAKIDSRELIEKHVTKLLESPAKSHQHYPHHHHLAFAASGKSGYYDQFKHEANQKAAVLAIMEQIKTDPEAIAHFNDIMKEKAQQKYNLPKDESAYVKVDDVKPARLPSGAKVEAAGNIDTAMAEMTKLIQSNTNMKAVGTGYAWADILGTDGEFIDTMNSNNQPNPINDVLNYDDKKDLLLPKWSTKYDDGYIVCAGSGCTYQKLNQYTWPCPPAPTGWKPNGNINAVQRQTIWKDQSKGIKYKYLPNQPGYQGLSLGGSINVGVQGNGVCKTPEIAEVKKDIDDGKPVYKIDRSQAPGDFIRSMTVLIVNKDETGNPKVQKVQLEPKSNPVHDPAKWAEKYGANGDSGCTFKLYQDDDLFYGSIISLGTIGIHVAYIFELIDASFEEEHRYIVTWDKFKSEHWPQIQKDIANGEIVRLLLWLSPYKTLFTAYQNSPPIVVSTYRLTENIPPKVLTAENAGSARVGIVEGMIAGAAATLVSQTAWLNLLCPYILMMTLATSAYGGKPLAMDPFAALALGASVLVPSNASGNAVDYKDMIAATEAWQEFGSEGFPWTSIVTVPTAIRFSCITNQLLSIANTGSTIWFEDVTLDWTNSKWPQIGKVPNGWQHLVGIAKLFHDSDTYKGRYNWGLNFDVKTAGPLIWRNQQSQITEFVNKVYKTFTYENGPFVNQFTGGSGIDAMAWKGKSIAELLGKSYY